MNTLSGKICLKLATALLLQHGEVSTEDIKAMPFFTDPSESEAVINSLIRTFNVEIYQKRVSLQPIPEWEEVIRIKKEK